MRNIAMAAALAVAAGPAVAAQDDLGGPLIDALRACQSQSDATRLACLDTATKSLLGAVDKRQVRIVDHAAVVRAKRSLFGFTLVTGNLFGERAASGHDDDGTDVKQITGAITQARTDPTGMWVFTIENGGVWQTTIDSISFSPRVGDQATIKAGILGHYTVRIGNGRTVDVKRLR